MGMSASQARLLSITSRMNDIELRSQQISNTKIRLADESEQVANDYNKALNASKLTYTDYSSGQAQQVDLTPKNLSEFGYKLVNRETGEIFKGDVDASTMYEMIESGQFYIGEGGDETTSYTYEAPKTNNSGIHYVPKRVAHTFVENAKEITVSGNTQMAIQSDDTNLAKAEAEYNAKTAKINSKEKKLDQQMKEMDTEHNALKTEYDSVKSLISDNISKSFQLFS